MKIEKEKNVKDMDASNEVASGLNRQAELSNCNFVKTVLMLTVVVYHCML